MTEHERTIAVVDGNSLIHRAFHALPPTMTAPDGRPTNAAFGFVSMLVKLVGELRPDSVIVAFDRGKPAFRTEALEQYKVHRPPTADELRAQFPIVKDLLAALDVPVVEADGWEGDDILGTLAVRGVAEGMKVLLVTGDRDAFQLVNDRVSVVTTKKGITDIAVLGPDDVFERYGVTPAQVPDYLGLKGDTSDNIPGVPGIGEKTAAKLLQEFGSLDALLARAEEVPGKVGESLRENRGAALASRTVATIVCDVPLDFEIADAPPFGTFDLACVAEAFGALRFTALLDRVLALRTSSSGGAGDRRPDVAVANAAVASTGDADASAQPASTLVGECRSCATGPRALELVREWSGLPEWLGVAIDDGAGESLFGDKRELCVATAEEAAVVPFGEPDVVLAELLRRARVAAADAKALLADVCPADETRSCDPVFEEVQPERLFDVAVASYLLESGRSSYDLGSLHADYLGRPLPEATDAVPRVALLAHASQRLATKLEALLEADGSTECFRRIEMPLVPVLVRMERVGVGIDTSVLATIAEGASGSIDQLRAEIWELAGCEFTIDSPKQLAEVLFEKLGLPTQRRTKTGFSTDAGVLATLAPAHPIAEKIVAYRELTKLKSTYIDALPRMLGEDGRLHTSFNQTVAATGRLSSSNPNLQNIPVRTELGRRIRAAFVPADAGDLMVSADYSQIELRILAHLSEDEGLIEAFTSGADFHAATASRVFGVPLEELTPEHRRRAKAVNFGIVYGISAHGLSESLSIERAEAQAMIDRYYAAYPGVRSFLDETVAAAHRDGFAVTMYGRKRRIPELKSSNYNLRSFGERTAMNHPMQGSAADIMKLAMIEVDRRLRAEGLKSRMVLQVHDELVFEAPAVEVASLEALVRDAMTGVAAMRVPLEVSVASGANWAVAK
jgi:DNA polymerase-1